MYLRQATSATVMLGPFTGSDGAALTGLTLTQSEFMLSKNATAFVAKNETTNGSHRILGYYSAMFDDTDTGSLGRLLIVSSAAAALPVWQEYTVLPQRQFDFYIGVGSSVLFNMQQAELLAVDMSSVTGIATRSPINAFRAIRNRITSSGTVMAVYAEDDTTAVWTSTITTNASADPIVESNPA